jgi:hypothetical protein
MISSYLAQNTSGDALDVGTARDAPGTAHHELAVLFALQAVKAWLESHTLPELLSFLQIDPARFGSFLGRLAPAHWPVPRVDPDRNTTVIAVSRPLWDLIAPPGAQGLEPDARWPRSVQSPTHVPQVSSLSPRVSFVLLDWDSRGDKIVVLRTVQGLSQGWRGFPGMPGQVGAVKAAARVGDAVVGPNRS